LTQGRDGDDSGAASFFRVERLCSRIPLRPESEAIPCRQVTAIDGYWNSLKSRLTITRLRVFLKNSFVRFHSWQSIFPGIAWIAADVVLHMIGRMPFIGLINLILWPVVGLALLILWLVVMINAFNGKRFKLPFIGNLAEKQAGA
jgi:uncharacterized membrane protein